MTEDPRSETTRDAGGAAGGNAAGLEVPPPPAGAREVFGERLGLAKRYVGWLAGAGLERGLMGPRERPRLWDRHVLNCAAAQAGIGHGETVVDIGSGAGLPGIPLALARPDLTVTLVEPLLRRVTFLEEVIADLGLGVRVVRGRAEEKAVRADVGGADVVTSRAVAPLERLAGWSAPLLREGGRMVALKGISAEEEVARDSAALARLGFTDARVNVVTAPDAEETRLVIATLTAARSGDRMGGRGSRTGSRRRGRR
ncbi:MAG TPA: 16S rRNA (guanine(527)-N(7))-methyltransferase RsmG [Actinomycetales bacterium]|nr:16S rRNA (guanine(527)-N(7))-methyltransferase RsmG [Actinomycetales bacterium]